MLLNYAVITSYAWSGSATLRKKIHGTSTSSLITQGAEMYINPNWLHSFQDPFSLAERFNYLLIQHKACMVAAIKLSELTNLFLTGA